MAYIGRSVDVGMFEKQVITADSSTTTFTLTFAVGSANSLLVVYGGVVQEPAVAYSVSGGGQQIVFSEAPVTGTTTYIIYLGKQLTTPRAAGQETTKQTFAGDGSTVTFTLTDPPVVPAGIMVFVDGILQREGSGNNYVSSGSTITFTSAPDSSAEIDVYTLVKEKVSIDTVADGSITVTKLAAGHPTWNGAGETVIASASTGNSLRITNTGSGNSLLVEDSASTDSTPFVVDATGNVGIGIASPLTKLQVVGTTLLSSASTYGASTAAISVYNGSSSANYYKADNHYFQLAAGTDTVTINSAGNVGIGTSSPSEKLEVYGITPIFQINDRGLYQAQFGLIGNDLEIRGSSGVIEFYTGAADGASSTLKATLDSVGNLGIGTSSPSSKLEVAGALTLTSVALPAAGTARLYSRNTDNNLYIQTGSGNILYLLEGSQNTMYAAGPTLHAWQISNSERMRINAAGYLKVSNTGTYQSSSSSNHELRTSSSSDFSTYITNSSATTPYGLEIQFTAAAPNNTSQSFCLAEDTANLRFVVMANGGIKNFQGNNVNLSDRREKTNFAPADSYLDKICAIPVQTFNYIDQNMEEDGGLTLGVVAQDVQSVAPELVMESNWANTDDEPKMRLSIYQTDLQYALMKSIQELKAIVDAQAVEIAALKAK